MKKSTEIKNSLTWYYRFKRGMAVCTEYNNHWGLADVFCINKSFKTIEIEIKCSKADFMSELVCLKKIILNHDWTGSPNKYHKHLAYLHNFSFNKLLPRKDWKHIPNKFYFCVTSDLVEFAKKSLEYTPYGLIDAGTLNIIKPAKDLHNVILEPKEVLAFALRVSSEFHNLKSSKDNYEKLYLQYYDLYSKTEGYKNEQRKKYNIQDV